MNPRTVSQVGHSAVKVGACCSSPVAARVVEVGLHQCIAHACKVDGVGRQTDLMVSSHPMDVVEPAHSGLVLVARMTVVAPQQTVDRVANLEAVLQHRQIGLEQQ